MQNFDRKEKAKELIRELPKGTLIWYPFEKGAKALCVDGGDFRMEELLRNKRVHYAHGAGIGVIERCAEPAKLLCRMRKALKTGGRLLLGTDNRLGLRYFCGDHEDHTGRVFDGLENYQRENPQGVGSSNERSYAAAELESFLSEAGLENFKRYSVFPNLRYPQIKVFSQGVCFSKGRMFVWTVCGK